MGRLRRTTTTGVRNSRARKQGRYGAVRQFPNWVGQLIILSGVAVNVRRRSGGRNPYDTRHIPCSVVFVLAGFLNTFRTNRGVPARPDSRRPGLPSPHLSTFRALWPARQPDGGAVPPRDPERRAWTPVRARRVPLPTRRGRARLASRVTEHSVSAAAGTVSKTGY